MANNKVTLHRVFSAPHEKVYKALTDEDAMASWLPPYGFVCKVHSLDFQIGGRYKISSLWLIFKGVNLSAWKISIDKNKLFNHF